MLFGTQRVVDTLIDDIAYTIGVDRASLRVVCAKETILMKTLELTQSSKGVRRKRLDCGMLLKTDAKRIIDGVEGRPCFLFALR